MIDWSALLSVVLGSLGAGVAVVALVAFALVGLSARVPVAEGGDPARRPSLSPGAGTAVAAVCLLAAVAIVAYGLYIIIS